MKDDTFSDFAVKTAEHSRLLKTAQYIQHGNTSCLLHSIAVAYFCYRLSVRLGFLRLHKNELVRGALLHDYYLYDWHVADKTHPHRLHGFRHPRVSLENAETEFSLSPREKNSILTHMFPLTPRFPNCREAWIICIADKICSTEEVFCVRSKKKIPLEDEINELG